jgi:glycine/D-amino acid oxidase-like deaminating enzyme/nitrite reductase/ring-hydroxylating ferredoxin subunit
MTASDGGVADSFTSSIWMAGAPEPVALRPLEADAETDVCVVGAGIAGLTTAHLLARAGRRVIVLEASGIGGGESLRTTAHLVTALDNRYYELEKIHGTSAIRLLGESQTAAIDQIESICASLDEDCEFERVDGYLFLPPEARQREALLSRELEAARTAGLQVERAERARLGTYEIGPCLRFPRQAQFHPRKYLDALARAVLRGGGRIANSRVRQVKGGADGVVSTVDGHGVRAGSVVVATNTPFNNRLVIHSKQAAYRTYVIAVRVPRESLERALYWDGYWGDEAAYHYVRWTDARTPEQHYLIAGGEDHKTGQDEDAELRFARLERWVRQRFPQAGPTEYRWSGQIMEPNDGISLIGPNPLDDANVYVATGDSGTGLTHGTIAGMLITDCILGRNNPWAQLYDPSRKPIRAAGEFARENLNAVAQYRDWLRTDPPEIVERMPRESGVVLQRGLKKIACYRDAAGVLFEHSAVCPHLGCIVRWNSVERTWDCPCHGSRFDPLGRVLHGPAVDDLPQIDADGC